MQKSSCLKWVTLILSISVLAGCASSGSSDIFSQQTQKDYSNMYLRGVFNWWEAGDDYKLIAQSSDEYSVTIELIADGQPYDFKVADNIWSMALNCGNRFGAVPMQLNDSVELVCASDSLNLQFTPSETGFYTFTLDVSDNDEPELSIARRN